MTQQLHSNNLEIATRRIDVLSNHLQFSNNIQRMNQTTITTNSTSSQKNNKNSYKTMSADNEFSLREYVLGEDDAAFKALDFLCCQGVATQLVTEFLLKYAFEQIQPRGWCVVVETSEDEKMVGIARSYVYDCLVNGVRSVTSYPFLMRVHPHYRRKNLALWMTTELFYHDLQTANVDYLSSWVVADNVSSLGLQERIAAHGGERAGMPPPDTLGIFRNLGVKLEYLQGSFLSSAFEISASSFASPYENSFTPEIQHITDPSEQEKLITGFLSDRQFVPLDLQVLYSSPLNLGSFVIKDPSTGLPAAFINVWNSGEVRVSFFRNSDFRSEGAILFYNHWYDESSPSGLLLFKILIENVAHLMSSKGFKFLFFFFPENLPIFTPELQAKAKINLLWKSRIWYTSLFKPKLDHVNFPSLFYDPRQCLI